jgi:hypothetical protein
MRLIERIGVEIRFLACGLSQSSVGRGPAGGAKGQRVTPPPQIHRLQAGAEESCIGRSLQVGMDPPGDSHLHAPFSERTQVW